MFKLASVPIYYFLNQEIDYRFYWLLLLIMFDCSNSNLRHCNHGKCIQLFSRFLETDHIRHCVPDNVSSGLSSLPLPHVYVDGVVQSDQSTTQELPSGHKLNGTRAYLKLMSIFTTLEISPSKLKKIAEERLDGLILQVSGIQLFSEPLRQHLHRSGLICKRVVFHVVTPSVYTTLTRSF